MQPRVSRLDSLRSASVQRSRSQVRALAQNHPHLQNDPTYARLVMRRVSPPITYAIVRWTGLSADAITGLAIISGVGAAGLLLLPRAPAYVGAAALLQLAYLFDTVDGEVARVRGTASRRGTYLDLIGHIFQNQALYAAASVVLLRAADWAPWAVAISFAGLALASPFGEYARAQVIGSSAELPSAHSSSKGARGRPSTRPLGLAYWAYRRVAFLWEYPASMNLFCIALLADSIRMVLLQGVPLLLPTFTALFLGTLAIKQSANALRILASDQWGVPRS
jgi:phosphatidylglycerophosphate synthase